MTPDGGELVVLPTYTAMLGLQRLLASRGLGPSEADALLFGVSIRDVNFSFKLMKREVLDALDLKSEGSLIDAELVVKAIKRGFSVQQIGLDYFPRVHGTSHLSSPGVIVKMMRELIKLYFDMKRRVPRRNSPVVEFETAHRNRR